MSLWDLVVTMAVTNVLSFGSPGTMVALLQRSLVQDSHTLSTDQLLYAYAIARVTPGQVNLFVASLGYMVFGLPGAVLSILAIVAPSYLILPLARVYGRVREARVAYGFTRGLIGGAVGVLLATTWSLGSGALSVPVAWLVFPAALLLLFFSRLPTIASLLLASALGVVVAALFPGML